MNTPTLKALHEVAERIALQLREGQTVKATLAGGMATYVHVLNTAPELAAAVRYSDDVDMHFSRPLNLPDEIVVLYHEPEGLARAITLDRNYSTAIGLCHPDALDDARPLMQSDNGRLHLHILTPIDLAVTKVGRFQDHDRQDIELLTRAGLLNAQDFRQRATEALDYLATDPVPVALNIEEAVKLIQA